MAFRKTLGRFCSRAGAPCGTELEAAGLATAALDGATDGAGAEGETEEPPQAATTRLSNAPRAIVR